MNWLRGTGFRALIALLVVLLGTTAFAQVAKSPGFKVGEGHLHPFLELDGRFDSVAVRFVPNVDSPELIFHARGGLKFDLDTPSTLVNFNGAGEYVWYTGLLSPGTGRLSRPQYNVALDTKFNRDGVAEVQLGASGVYSDRTQNPTFAVGVLSNFLNAYLAVPIHPGGRALEVTPKIATSFEFFTAQDGSGSCPPAVPCSNANYGNANFGLNARWKFLPKTAVIVDVNSDYRFYLNAAAITGNRVLFRAQAGLAGLISPRIAVTLMVGYGGDFTTGSIHTVVGNAEVSYTVSEQSRIAVGYARNVMAVPLVGTAMDDRGYLRGGLGLLGGRLLLNAQVSADYFTYLGAAAVPNDLLLSASAGPTFTVTSWFDVGAAYTLSWRLTSFVRHEALLRLAFHY